MIGAEVVGYLLTAGGELIDVPNLTDHRRNGTAEPAVYDFIDAASVPLIRMVGLASIYRKDVGVVIEPETPVIWQGDGVTKLQDVTDQPDPQLRLKQFPVISNAQ